MNHNSNDPARFDGHDNDGADETQPLESGVLPRDFGQRLERLKEASGLSWRGFAKALGVDPKQAAHVAQEGRRALRGSHALHSPLRVRDTRRSGGPPGRGVPDDLLRGG